MPSWILWVLGVLVFILILVVSVGLHEGGHMLAAKKFKLNVPKFFVGFGPTIWSFKKGKGINETEYGIKAIPLGGFVEIFDPEITDKEDPKREMLSNVKPWKRQIVFAAGPMVNIVLGFTILVILFMVAPTPIVSTTIGTVNSCTEQSTNCGAETAGILPNDKIVEIDGVTINKINEISSNTAGKESVNIVVERNGELIEQNIKMSNDGYMGISMQVEERRMSFPEAVNNFGEYISTTLNSISTLPSQTKATVEVIGGAERGDESLGSVISMGKAYGDVSATDKIQTNTKIKTYFMWFGLVNLSLGVINLLPIGILDGSRMLIAFIDSIRLRYSEINKKWKYSPLSMKYVQPIMITGSIFIFGFMGLLILADIVAPVSVI